MNTEKAEKKLKTSQLFIPSKHPVSLILVIVDFYCETINRGYLMLECHRKLEFVFLLPIENLKMTLRNFQIVSPDQTRT